MKKVLLVTGSLNTGGLEKVAMDFVRYSDRNKYRFDFLIYKMEVQDFQAEAEHLGCGIIRIQGPSDGYIGFYYELRTAIEKNGPYDIVHSHTYYNSAIVMIAAKKCQVPLCISHSHSVARINDKKIKNRIAYPILRKLFKIYSDKYCACSLAAGEHVFGVEEFKEKGTVIVNPIDVNAFRYDEIARNKIRKSLHIADSQYVLGNVGRMAAGKNLSFLIDVLNIFNNNDVILLLVGDGEERKKLEKYAKTQGVYSQVRFVGMRSNVADYLSAMDLFVMPSKHEGLGISLIEAMANGLYCIFERNAIVDEIKELSHSYPIKGYDPQQWKNKIDELISNQGNIERKSILDMKQFDISELSRKIDQLYGWSVNQK